MTTPDFRRRAAGDYRSGDGSFRIRKGADEDTWTLQRHTSDGWRKMEDGFATRAAAQEYLSGYLR